MNKIITQKKDWFCLFLALSIVLTFVGCKGFTDSSKPFVNGDEITYLAKSDSVQLLSGKNRAILKIAIPVDPHITKVKIGWNSSEDSVIKKIPENEKFLSVEIDSLDEGTYTFHIYTLNNEDDISLGQDITGRVYGKNYKKSLLPRFANDVKLDLSSGNLTLKWGSISSQMVGTKIMYSNKSNKKSTLFVPNDSAKTLITDVKIGSILQIKSLFSPDSTAIDTFYSAADTARIDNILVPNSTYPIQHAPGEYDGKRRGNPAAWMVNEVIRGKKLGLDGKKYGGWDGLHGGGYLTMSSEGGDTFKNGKIYQTHILAKGRYTFKTNFDHQDGIRQAGNENTKQYVVVAKGQSLPNINELSSALAFSKFEHPSVQFTLSESTKISFGFVCSYLKNGEYFRSSSITLDISH